MATASVKKEVLKPYKDEVLGHSVLILFEVEGGSTSFYQGVVTEVNSKLLKGGRVSIKHFVEFEDGEEHWLDLVNKEKLGHLQWPEATKAKEMVATSPTKKVKLEDTKPAAKAKEMVSPSPTKKVKLEDTNAPAAKLVKKEKDEESAGSEDSIVEGDESEEEDSVDEDDFVLPDPPPKTLDAIVHLMDEMEPEVAIMTGKGYFEKQADNRGGCSKTRGKLRKLARAHPDHPAVRHWMETGKWQPPNAATLRAMMDLIKTWHYN